MSVAEIISEIDILPAPERWRVLEHTRHLLEPETSRATTQNYEPFSETAGMWRDYAPDAATLRQTAWQRGAAAL